MNEIETLIKELCPDGVEFKSIEEVANVGTGRSDRKDAVGNGEYPFYVRSQDILRINSYEFDEEAIIIPGEGGIGEIFHYVNEKYALHQRAYRINFFDKRVNTKFAYYYFIAGFKTFILSKAVSATVTSIRKPMITKFKIPVPPLEVQEKIVKVLDKMTQLEAALEAELSLRRQQYEYYRNALLTFDLNGGGSCNPLWARVLELCPDGVEFRSLGDVCEYSKQRIAAISLNENNYVGVDNLLQNKQGKKLSSYVPKEGNLTKFEVTDVLIGNIRPYLKKIWFADCEGGASGDVLVIQIKPEYTTIINPIYLYYLLSSDQFFDYVMQYSKGAKMPRGDKSSVLRYRLYIPPLEIQEQIVEILDKFDKLTNDLTDGLPAEIEARRQQYEYYRNRLLSFPEKTAKFS